MSELVCRPTHALQAIYKGMMMAHPQMWKCVAVEDMEKLYAGLMPTPRSVWQHVSPVNEIMTRQEEKVFLRRFVLSLNPRMLGLFLRFVSGSSYIGPKIKVDFNSQEAGFLRSPLANTCISILNHSDEWFMDMQ